MKQNSKQIPDQNVMNFDVRDSGVMDNHREEVDDEDDDYALRASVGDEDANFASPTSS